MALWLRMASVSSSEPQADVPVPKVSSNGPIEGQVREQSLKKKTNMVSREVRVIATGVQLGKTGGERELFTEDTSSVLVHENGGVVQLSESVVPGQLFLLASVESKAEVVARVKRTYHPMNRCVELEFAEAAPRFWLWPGRPRNS